MSQSLTPPALVTPLELSGLEAVRLLGRRNLRVYGYDANPDAIGRYSRYRRQLPGRELLEGLLALEGAVVIPTADHAVWWLQSNAAALAGRVRFVIPTPEIIESCTDKVRLCAWAGQAGVPAVPCLPLDHLLDNPDACALPCVVKRRGKYHASEPDPILRGRKFLLLSEPRQVAQVLAAAPREVLREHLVQEYLLPHGGHPAIYITGYLSARGHQVSFAHHKLWTVPPQGGRGVYLELIERGALEERVMAWLREVGYTGLFGAEFLYDGRDEVYRLLDFNPRFGVGDSIGIGCGIDMAHIAYQDAQGLWEGTSRRRAGSRPARWVSEFDFLSSVIKPRPSFTVVQTPAWRSWFYRPLQKALWDLRDPIPFFVAARMFAGNGVRKARKFLSRRPRGAA